MTIVVNPHNEQEEKVLLAFLESLQYDYEASKNEDVVLSEAQQQELLRRRADIHNGKAELSLLDDLLDDLERVYR